MNNPKVKAIVRSVPTTVCVLLCGLAAFVGGYLIWRGPTDIQIGVGVNCLTLAAVLFVLGKVYGLHTKLDANRHNQMQAVIGADHDRPHTIAQAKRGPGHPVGP